MMDIRQMLQDILLTPTTLPAATPDTSNNYRRMPKEIVAAKKEQQNILRNSIREALCYAFLEKGYRTLSICNGVAARDLLLREQDRYVLNSQY
jgi:hypothetical protein